MTDIGITASENPNILSDESFTWATTLGLFRATESKSSYYERSYFLGTPKSLAIAESGDDICLLVFEGATEIMKFPAPGEMSTGNCTDSFGGANNYYEAFLSQIKEERKKLKPDAKGKCELLKKALQDSPPVECSSVAPRDSWGQIDAKGT